MNSPRHHAVVIGASIAGLLAARALSDTYPRVTVLDRDTLPSGPAPRQGVPQGRQAHGLLAAGSAALEDLFPGFLTDLIAAGAVPGDVQEDFRWYLDGHPVAPATSGLIGYALSRPLLEDLIRLRVAALDGVRLRDCTEVTGLVASADGDRAIGVRARGRGEDAVEFFLQADLVVDATGRGSRAPLWLDELGYPKPTHSRIRPDVTYVTRHYRRESHHLQGRVGAAFVPHPGQPRAGVVIRQEGDRLVVLMIGMLGESPPTDDAGLLAFAESLPGPDLTEVVRSATPLDEPVKMRYPVSVRHHYEELERYLGGFVVMGDALCCFNPIYGQGMSVAALEAQVLRDLLREGSARLPDRFFRAVAGVVAIPWSLAASADLRFTQVVGERAPIDRPLNWYLAHYRVAASVDAGLGTAFLQVANLMGSPLRLFTPGKVLRVWRGSREARRRAPAEAVARLSRS